MRCQTYVLWPLPTAVEAAPVAAVSPLYSKEMSELHALAQSLQGLQYTKPINDLEDEDEDPGMDIDRVESLGGMLCRISQVDPELHKWAEGVNDEKSVSLGIDTFQKSRAKIGDFWDPKMPTRRERFMSEYLKIDGFRS